ncbi:hypothetical protein ABPG72_002176 [Tetrahymena utriculariae]
MDYKDKNEIRLTEDQIADFREAFSLFDKESSGYIKISDLGLLVRSLNHNPTDAEIQEYIQEVDSEGIGKIDFPEFIALMARKMKDIDHEEELMEAFRVFDKNNTGLIESQVLKHLVKGLGEPLSEEETEVMIKEANPDTSGQIRYADFVRLMTTSYIS